jgi:ankyrin repeat protein
MLIEAGANINVRIWNDKIALHWSIEHYDWEVGHGFQLETMPLFLKAGSDTCIVNRDGQTALSYACRQSYPGDLRMVDAARLLLECDAKKVIDLETPILRFKWLPGEE